MADADWDKEIERSGSGSPIHRYESGTRDFEFAPGDDSLIDAVAEHIKQHVGDPEWVWHEMISDLIHVDIHVVAPTEARPCITLVTSGMAERPMNAPPEASACEFAELTLSLPPDWPGLANHDGQPRVIDDSHPLRDEANYWPIRWLKMLARFPHEYGTWIWHGHTIPNGDPAEPFAPNTRLAGWMLMPSMMGGEAFRTLRVGDRDIAFFAIWPLYPEEMQYKLDHGADALLDRFEKARISPVPELIDVTRPNVCLDPNRRKRRWWPFGL